MHEKFHWTTPSGAEIVLPRIDQIKTGVIRKVRNLSETDQMFTLLEEIADEATLALIDDLTGSELEAMAEAWQKEVPVGESSGSSTSSTPTGEPSSTTSAPASPASVTV